MERTLEIEKLLNEAGWLRRLAASVVGEGQAEDLVQDTWVAALRRPPRAEGELKPWLARVTRNLGRNARRERSRREAREVLAQEAEAQRLLAEAVTRLAEPLRAVIVLRYFQGLDSSAAAARLELPASTVRTRLQRALEELRADLDRRSDGGRASWAAILAPLAKSTGADASATLVPAASGAGPIAALGALGSWPALALGGALAACALVAVATSVRTAEHGPGPGPDPVVGAEVAAALPATSELQEPRPASGAERRPVDARPEKKSAGADAGAGAPAPAQTAENVLVERAQVSGTILVDGRAPEWPLELVLEPDPPPARGSMEERVMRMRALTDELRVRERTGEKRLRARGPGYALTLGPERGGAFAFGELPAGWSGRLVVQDHTLADGSASLAVQASATELVVHLRSGPAITGRILRPDGRPAGGVEGAYELEIGSKQAPADEVNTRGFACRDDGRFRIPSKTRGEWGTLTLQVEAQEQGFLLFEAPSFVPTLGLDLGDLVLEPLRALEFTVRDPGGAPIAKAFARVDGPAWFKRSPLTGADGTGTLPVVPARAADVRFSAYAFADRVVRVEPGDTPEVVLEPLAVLEVRMLGEVSARADRLFLSAERSAFLYDESGWDEIAAFQNELGAARPSMRRGPGPDGARAEYEFLRTDATLELVGLAPGLVLSIEAQDHEHRSLAAASVSLAPGERAVLELGEPGPGGEAPVLKERRLRTPQPR